MEDEPAKVVIELSNAETLVFFEFLSRFKDTGKISIEDQAEERVLWNLQCLLEKKLAEPFLPNYAELIQTARERVSDVKE